MVYLKVTPWYDNLRSDPRFQELLRRMNFPLAATRAVPGMNWVNLFAYRAAYLKEEGDLAAIVGDTVGAIRAYNHYLTLRSDPDSGAAQQEVDQVRAALAQLAGEGR